MPVQYFALWVGVIYTLLGVLGFVPALVEPAQAVPEYMAKVGVTEGFGYLFGLFPVNIVENILHVIIGVFGIAVFLLTDRVSRLYADILAVWLGILGVFGLIPFVKTALGLMPLFGGNIALHLVTAAIAAYFGFFRDAGYLFSTPEQVREYEDQQS